MMRMALVGICGYGDLYLNMMEQHLEGGTGNLTAVIDPYAENSSHYEALQRRKIPIYRDLEEFYEKDFAELVIISSPVQFHKKQTMLCLSKGSHVLCEKPLAPTLEDVEEIRHSNGYEPDLLGVGFQWSFSPTMRALKRDILAGKFGCMKYMKTHISWQRDESYYTKSSWHGRLKNAGGELILDSILSNAVAHYLHNMFFLMGENESAAAMPEEIEGSVYRGKDIESYDTCFIRGCLKDHAPFLIVASHSAEKNTNPKFEYAFEHGTVYFNQDENPEVYAIMEDGSRVVYGKPLSGPEQIEKVRVMQELTKNGGTPPCTLDTVIPHLAVCNAVAREMEIQTFPEKMKYDPEGIPSVWVHGLFKAMETCYEKMLLPDEAGYEWAAKSRKVKL